MKKIISIIFVLSLTVLGTIRAQVPAGLPVPLALAESISSKTLTEGQTVKFFVSSEVYDSEGEVVIPQNATAYGTVKSVKKRGGFAKGGKFTLSIDYLTLPNGQKVELEADDLSAKGKSGSAISTAMKVCYWMCWTILIDACIKGGYATLDAGTAVQAYTK